MLRIQPDEGASLQFNAKIPGPSIRIDGVRMDFNYEDYFDAAPSTGYETLIYDCMIGDPTLFQRADNIETGWRVVQPILDVWRERKTGTDLLPGGQRRAPAAAELLSRGAASGARSRSGDVCATRRLPGSELLVADVDGTLVTNDKRLTSERPGRGPRGGSGRHCLRDRQQPVRRSACAC